MLENYIANDYWRALATFVVVFVLIRLLIFILSKILPRFTSWTKTTVDDVILRKVSFPFTLIALLVGVRFAIGELKLQESFNSTIEEMIVTLIILVAAFLIYYIIEAVITVGFEELGESKRRRVNRSLLYFFHSVLKIVMISIALLVVLASWGVEIAPLLAGLGVAGVAIAFALQATLSNVFGGVSVLLDKSVQVGDVIKLDDNTMGKVLMVNLRSTKVLNFDNELVIIPNSKLAGSNIQNLAQPSPKSRVVVPFDVAYGTDIEKVKKIVIKELRDIKNFVDDPEPTVRLVEMNNSSLKFKALFYVDSYENKEDAIDEANTKIYNAFSKNRIEIKK